MLACSSQLVRHSVQVRSNCMPECVHFVSYGSEMRRVPCLEKAQIKLVGAQHLQKHNLVRRRVHRLAEGEGAIVVAARPRRPAAAAAAAAAANTKPLSRASDPRWRTASKLVRGAEQEQARSRKMSGSSCRDRDAGSEIFWINTDRLTIAESLPTRQCRRSRGAATCKYCI